MFHGPDWLRLATRNISDMLCKRDRETVYILLLGVNSIIKWPVTYQVTRIPIYRRRYNDTVEPAFGNNLDAVNKLSIVSPSMTHLYRKSTCEYIEK